MPETPDSSFIYICTQKGSENLCKAEIAKTWPQLRFAFSRPGFLTFKTTDDFEMEERFDLKSVFARASGFSGKRLKFDFEAESDEAFETELLELLKEFDGSQIHIWSRDMMVAGTAVPTAMQPGLGGLIYNPGTNAFLGQLINAVQNSLRHVKGKEFHINKVASADEKVFDLIMVEPDQIWTGSHHASTIASRWPGGIPKIKAPEKMISRAFLKVSEALRWSRLPLKEGDVCVEIGSSPGGTAQALLSRGAHVIGVDPAEMDESIAKHPNLNYIRCRGNEVRCKDLRHAKWLLIDTNAAPKHSLDTVERIVTNQAVSIRGMLLTIKLTNEELAEGIPDYLQRIRDWGFNYVRARQLAFQRNEFCIAAFRNKAMLRVGS